MADSSDITVVLLMQISHQLAGAANGTSIPAISSEQIAFTVTHSASLVNILWFLSLAFSLSSALAATLVKNWVRNYLYMIERRPAPHRKARIRSYLYEGLQTFGLPLIVEIIPNLLHISLFLFFAGLFEFLFPINNTVAYIALGTLVLSVTLYSTATLLSMMFSNCPFLTPLSMAWWYLWVRLQVIARYFASSDTSAADSDLIPRTLSRAVRNTAVIRSEQRLERDIRALSWTIYSLTEESEFESFLEGLPDLTRSFDGSEIFQALGNNMAINLNGRIISLLLTCNGTAAAALLPRQERAILCCRSLLLLSHRRRPPKNLMWWERKNLLGTLHKFASDDNATIARFAKCTTLIMIHDSFRQMDLDAEYDGFNGYNDFVVWMGNWCNTLGDQHITETWIKIIVTISNTRTPPFDNLYKAIRSIFLLIRIEAISYLLEDPAAPEELIEFLSILDPSHGSPTSESIQAIIVDLTRKVTNRNGGSAPLPKTLAQEVAKVLNNLDNRACLQEALQLLKSHVASRPESTWAVESIKKLQVKLNSAVGATEIEGTDGVTLVVGGDEVEAREVMLAEGSGEPGHSTDVDEKTKVVEKQSEEEIVEAKGPGNEIAAERGAD